MYRNDSSIQRRPYWSIDRNYWSMLRNECSIQEPTVNTYKLLLNTHHAIMQELSLNTHAIMQELIFVGQVKLEGLALLRSLASQYNAADTELQQLQHFFSSSLNSFEILTNLSNFVGALSSCCASPAAKQVLLSTQHLLSVVLCQRQVFR